MRNKRLSFIINKPNLQVIRNIGLEVIHKYSLSLRRIISWSIGIIKNCLAIQEDYNDYLNMNRGYRYTIARLVDEYWNLGEVENIIVATAIGEMLITHDKVFVGNLESITKCLSMFNPNDVLNELTANEISDLSQRINKVLEGLKKVEIDYNPKAEQQ